MQPTGTRIFCYMVVKPVPHERMMLQMHLRNALLTSCDGHAIYSNVTVEQLVGKNTEMWNDRRRRLELGQEAANYGLAPTVLGSMDGERRPFQDGQGQWHLSDPLVGRIHHDFIWPALIRDMRGLKYDWIVKVDPDTVLFPERLRFVLSRHDPLAEPAYMGTHAHECDKVRGQLSVYNGRALQLLAGRRASCGFSRAEVEAADESWLLGECFRRRGAALRPEPYLLGERRGCCGEGCAWAAATSARQDPKTFAWCLGTERSHGMEPCRGQARPFHCAA